MRRDLLTGRIGPIQDRQDLLPGGGNAFSFCNQEAVRKARPVTFHIMQVIKEYRKFLNCASMVKRVTGSQAVGTFTRRMGRSCQPDHTGKRVGAKYATGLQISAPEEDRTFAVSYIYSSPKPRVL